jgi:hypothetical protein
VSDAVYRLRAEVIATVLHGHGTASGDSRRAAFDGEAAEPARALVAKIAQHAWKVTREDIAAVQQAGLPEDAIFEQAVCAAVGKATRQLDTALAALAEAVAKP